MDRGLLSVEAGGYLFDLPNFSACHSYIVSVEVQTSNPQIMKNLPNLVSSFNHKRGFGRVASVATMAIFAAALLTAAEADAQGDEQQVAKTEVAPQAAVTRVATTKPAETAPATEPVTREPAVKAEEGGDCPVCHKGRNTLIFPCNSVAYRRHIAHGDTPAACPSAGARAE